MHTSCCPLGGEHTWRARRLAHVQVRREAHLTFYDMIRVINYLRRYAAESTAICRSLRRVTARCRLQLPGATSMRLHRQRVYRQWRALRAPRQPSSAVTAPLGPARSPRARAHTHIRAPRSGSALSFSTRAGKCCSATLVTQRRRVAERDGCRWHAGSSTWPRMHLGGTTPTCSRCCQTTRCCSGAHIEIRIGTGRYGGWAPIRRLKRSAGKQVVPQLRRCSTHGLRPRAGRLHCDVVCPHWRRACVPCRAVPCRATRLLPDARRRRGM